jgi:hypothetical protein
MLSRWLDMLATPTNPIQVCTPHPPTPSKTQNISILSIKVATSVDDMAGWWSEQTLRLNNAFDKVVISTNDLWQSFVQVLIWIGP